MVSRDADRVAGGKVEKEVFGRMSDYLNVGLTGVEREFRVCFILVQLQMPPKPLSLLHSVSFSFFRQ